MNQSVVALIFVVMVIVIVVLMFQVNDNSNHFRASRTLGQEQIEQAARQLVMSTSQSHPLFCFEHALNAKWQIDDAIRRNGGLAMAGKNLKLPKGRVENLRTAIHANFSDMQQYLMDELLARYPEQFDHPANEDAGLVARSRATTSSTANRRRRRRSKR